MKITFEPAAQRELEQIYFWIAKDNQRAAAELLARIEDKVMALGLQGFAHMWRPGLVEGTRELIEFPYIIVYRIDEDHEEIVVVSVVHGARKRTPGGEEHRVPPPQKSEAPVLSNRGLDGRDSAGFPPLPLALQVVIRDARSVPKTGIRFSGSRVTERPRRAATGRDRRVPLLR